MTTIKLFDVINLCLCSISLHVFVIDRGKESFEAPSPSLEFKEINVEFEYLSHKPVKAVHVANTENEKYN